MGTKYNCNIELIKYVYTLKNTILCTMVKSSESIMIYHNYATIVNHDIAMA